MAGWRDRWRVVVASGVAARDGLRWEFTDSDRTASVWVVFREDGGLFPVFSAARGAGSPPPGGDLRGMTEEAVADLLAAAGHRDQTGWTARNISGALMMASRDIRSWEGEEWALESDVRGEPIAWAASDDGRTPYAWLRAHGDGWTAVFDTYQDDALFGLNFVPTHEPRLPESGIGSRRPRRGLPLVTGRISQVDVVYDTAVEGKTCPGLVTEALLHGDNESTLLIAAEAYSHSEWHLYDESVVALTNPADADTLKWVPQRQSWRPTKAPDP